MGGRWEGRVSGDAVGVGVCGWGSGTAWQGSVGSWGRRGRRRMGTASRYGKICGSTVWGSDRFFHFDGVWEVAEAKRETGNGGFEDDADGADVVNGWREVGGGGE